MYQQKLEIQTLLSPVQLAKPNCFTQPKNVTQPEHFYISSKEITQTWFAGLHVFPGLIMMIRYISNQMLPSLNIQYTLQYDKTLHFEP